MRRLAALALLPVLGCVSPAVLVGKECSDAHPCPADMACVPATDGSTRVCVMAACAHDSDCVDGYVCMDGSCARVRPVSERTARPGQGAALGRGSSESYDVRVDLGNPAPAVGTSSSYRVTGGIISRP